MTALLTLQGAATPDTVILARDVFDLVQVVAAASIAVALPVIIVFLARVLAEIRRTVRAIEGAGQKIRTDPALESLRKAASHVESISRRFREEADKLSGSVSSVSDRLTQASRVTEERIEEFNALLAVVQREAEGAFVDGAAVARGIHAGLENLSGLGARHRSGSGPGDAADEELQEEEAGSSDESRG